MQSVFTEKHDVPETRDNPKSKSCYELCEKQTLKKNP